MLGDLGKAFARSGHDAHVRELRAGLFPLSVTMSLGFLAGWIVIILPWFAAGLLRVALAWSKDGYLANGEFVRAGTALAYYLMDTWYYGLLIGVLGIGLAWLRRYSARKNRYFVFQVGPDNEFRFGFDEIGAVVGITGILAAFSESARFFSVFTVFAAILIGIVWHELHDKFLCIYAFIRKQHGPEVVFAVLEAIRRNEIAPDAKISGVGARDGGTVVVLSGSVPPLAQKELQQRLPLVVEWLESVVFSSVPIREDEGFDPRVITKRG